MTRHHSEIETITHSLGTTGVIVKATLGLAPSVSHFDYSVAFDDFKFVIRTIPSLPILTSCSRALEFAERVANSPAIGLEDLSLFDAQYAALIEPLAQKRLPPKHCVVMATATNGSLDALDHFIRKYGGTTKL